MKKITLNSADEITKYIDEIRCAADLAQKRIHTLLEQTSDINFLAQLKFAPVGFDPLNTTRELNFIEQLNQTFTYLASMEAAQLLFRWHPKLSNLTLNLGTTPGSDLETDDCGGIAAEVFSATRPNSNNKLNKDIAKVAATQAKHKYAFFMCPDIDRGQYTKKLMPDVIIWSLGQPHIY